MAVSLYVAAPHSVRVIDVSPPSWMVEMVLVHKGLAYERHDLAFDRGEHRQPEILALNPRGTIPILVDDAAAVSETFAILDYLERTRPTPALLPPNDAPDRLARALTRLHQTEHHERLWTLPAVARTRSEAWLEDGRDLLRDPPR